jgi:hypothetical protein
MRAENYRPLPDDWHVCLCDVRNSTAAIERGEYRSVNSLGVAAITAILNGTGDLEIPFSFEGDGCVVCVPPSCLASARGALARTRQIARDSFGLDLRIGTVPVARLREMGQRVYVARYRVSETYVQAVFAGGGIAAADRLLKSPASAEAFAIEEDIAPVASLEGFECRWEDIPSRHGETVSLMVRVVLPDAEQAIGLYRQVVAKVREIYGDDETSHPLAVPDLTLSLSERKLGVEAGIRAAGRGGAGRWLWVQGARLAVLIGKVVMRYGLRTQHTDWSTYKRDLVRNADVRKFIDLYRHILAGNATQREALCAWLDERYARGELVYGVHVSDRAQMTCLVFDYQGRHVHFVDGADGGLFLASKAYKERLACLEVARAA